MPKDTRCSINWIGVRSIHRRENRSVSLALWVTLIMLTFLLGLASRVEAENLDAEIDLGNGEKFQVSEQACLLEVFHENIPDHGLGLNLGLVARESRLEPDELLISLNQVYENIVVQFADWEPYRWISVEGDSVTTESTDQTIFQLYHKLHAHYRIIYFEHEDEKYRAHFKDVILGGSNHGSSIVSRALLEVHRLGPFGSFEDIDSIESSISRNPSAGGFLRYRRVINCRPRSTRYVRPDGNHISEILVLGE